MDLRVEMTLKKITYPKELNDIPKWRQAQLKADLLWFRKYPPSMRLKYIEREWEETKKFIDRFAQGRSWKQKKK